RCGICLCDEPRSRDAFTECGHSACSACSACVAQMMLDARSEIKDQSSRCFCYEWIRRHLLREDSQARGDRFSRTCRGCVAKSPRQRSVSVECGHAVCLECADGADACPVCDTSTTFVNLIEEKRRHCGICLCKSPNQRLVFSDCGHIACAACAYELTMKNKGKPSPLACFFCRTPIKSPPITLKEEI
ncbi:hypothetical protein PENTCL1PPCAC_18672, partial [Pristionchus entomophagus]